MKTWGDDLGDGWQWCGHCKALAPEYDVVGSTFQPSDPVVVAKVDADAHRSLGSRFGVTGFPTLKWFPKASTTSEDYSGGRTADDIVSFINSKTGLSRRVKKAPTAVTQLTASNFDAIVMDETKDVLVEFYAPVRPSPSPTNPLPCGLPLLKGVLTGDGFGC